MSDPMRFRYVTRLDHEFNMRRALAEAKQAQCEGDRPAAAVLVDEMGRPVATAQSRVAGRGAAAPATRGGSAGR